MQPDIARTIPTTMDANTLGILIFKIIVFICLSALKVKDKIISFRLKSVEPAKRENIEQAITAIKQIIKTSHLYFI